jgi:hypothetical protein
MSFACEAREALRAGGGAARLSNLLPLPQTLAPGDQIQPRHLK